MAHDRQYKDDDKTDSKSKKKELTRVASDGQVELTIVDTPLYLACEEIILCKARVNAAKAKLDDAETACMKEMKSAKKKQINHKGDCLELVTGKTIEDHIRFKKP